MEPFILQECHIKLKFQRKYKKIINIKILNRLLTQFKIKFNNKQFLKQMLFNPIFILMLIIMEIINKQLLEQIILLLLLTLILKTNKTLKQIQNKLKLILKTPKITHKQKIYNQNNLKNYHKKHKMKTNYNQKLQPKQIIPQLKHFQKKKLPKLKQIRKTQNKNIILLDYNN